VGRALCTASVSAATTTKVKNALLLLGLEPGATPREIKMRYYDLAKRTHPDVLARQAREAAEAAASATGPQVSNYDDGVLAADHSAPVTTVQFREVQDAYDALLEAEEEAKGGGARKTGPPPGGRGGRARTFGEVLCDRLKDEPEATQELWEELVHQRVTCTAPMADIIFKACQRKGCDGMDLARSILREGTGLGLINQDVRCASLVSLLSWCLKEDLECADDLVDEANDLDRTDPGVMAAIGAVYCSGTRSPY